jgi:RNA-directed DNA polymerase
LAALTERLSQFGLAIHEGKTRLIAFGRRVARQRELDGEQRPETFDFLGFTHYCDKTRSGRFTVKKKTRAKLMVRKLQTLRSEMRERLHLPVDEQHQWLCQVLKGHYGYYGVIFNYRSMERFRHHVGNLWFLALKRRSQRAKRTWEWFDRLLTVFPLSKPVIHQLWFGARACGVTAWGGFATVRFRSAGEES